MFNVTLEGKERLIERLDQMPSSVQAMLVKKAGDLSITLQAHIKNDKLHGQVLGQRSGQLTTSIQQEVIVEDGKSVFGRVFSAGNVKYAAFWEYGFNGTESVKAYDRKRRAVGGRKAEGMIHVQAHSRNVNQAPRSFMRSSLADMADEIKGGLREAVQQGLQKK